MRTNCTAPDCTDDSYAETHYDRYGIYVTRKHPECLSDSDRSILRWVHTPDDGETLDAEDGYFDDLDDGGYFS